MSWSYSGDPSSSDIDAVRFTIQDTNSQAQLLQDLEIAFVILQETGAAATSPAVVTGASLYAAAAGCLETVAKGFLAQADTQVGQLKITSTKRALQYQQEARALRARAQGYYSPYAGGQSITEKLAFNADQDSVKPEFSRSQMNNPWTGEQDSAAYSTEDFGPPVG